MKARSVATVHGLCKLLETRLIRLCETIVEQLYEETEKDEPVVRQYLKELEKAVEFHKVFKPRLVESADVLRRVERMTVFIARIVARKVTTNPSKRRM